MSNRAGWLGLLLAAATLGGCGLGPGNGPDGNVRLTVTRDFGARQIVGIDPAKTAGSDTVMRVLQRNVDKVSTRFGGGFVQSINGVSGGRHAGRPVDWFIYVNGIQTEKGATSVDVHGGDRIWWDHHDWGATPDIPAIVGSFPEPFEHGSDGRKLPVRVECSAPQSGPCDVVANKLTKLGIVAGRSNLGSTPAAKTLRVLVGPWNRLRSRDPEAVSIDSGPRSSGVFARFAGAGDELVVLDERGRPARTLGAGTGLVAATKVADREPVWYITGTDDAGVASAARAFDEPVLENHFALAISHDLPLRVPLTGTQSP
ncbi:MAG: hypothetical protein QOG15_3710 [Solirubrobacteraceae bacterium]|jgi:hypothetical protein|nr:hypothetical protein [Solirubrobacteraceae bacterium]